MKHPKKMARRAPLERKRPQRRRGLDEVSHELSAERAVREGQAGAGTTRGKPRRNDSKWRSDCLAKRGDRCRACGGTVHVQMDHVISRAQGGLSIVENGLPLCGGFGQGCHDHKTAGRLKIQRSWLDQDMIDWLEREGHAIWLPDGTVAGRHNKIFADYDTEETRNEHDSD